MEAAPFYSRLLGTLLALAAASGTVLYDCHVSIQERLKRVPLPIYSTPQAIVLALACGAVAGIAFSFTTGKGDSLIDSVLGLKQSNEYLRGLCVGLTVLVLIRSKLSSIKGAEIGGELAYNSGRVWVMQALNERWRKFKSNFDKRNKSKALAIPGYEDRVIAELRDAIKIKPEDYRVFVESQIKNVQQSKPQAAFDPARLDWQTYYRTLTNLALDYAGKAVFEGWTQFD
jgi:hypothetical protein